MSWWLAVPGGDFETGSRQADFGSGHAEPSGSAGVSDALSPTNPKVLEFSAHSRDFPIDIKTHAPREGLARHQTPRPQLRPRAPYPRPDRRDRRRAVPVRDGALPWAGAPAQGQLQQFRRDDDEPVDAALGAAEEQDRCTRSLGATHGLTLKLLEPATFLAGEPRTHPTVACHSRGSGNRLGAPTCVASPPYTRASTPPTRSPTTASHGHSAGPEPASLPAPAPPGNTS